MTAIVRTAVCVGPIDLALIERQRRLSVDEKQAGVIEERMHAVGLVLHAHM